MRQAIGTILFLLWMVMVAVAIIALIRGHIDWLRLRNRKSAGVLLAASFVVVIAGGLSTPKHTDTKPAAAVAQSVQTTAAPTTTVAPAATSAIASSATTTATAPSATEPPDTVLMPNPNEVSCSDVGGVFVPHGIDGRGDCEPADSRPHCHVAPGLQDGNYVAELIMDPPFPAGKINLMVTRVELDGASNADCWKVPAK
ncbi:hypothetical protein [Nocardia sp. NBC_01327]|uniref:hypothetical protein n=1 Tax=Nocardia sp. NBC_01327 TaxID=2903593 RepID=UPI002E0E7771|nr:hypothetical protein OG326_23960 [Nocardia sp. NBC_01327]